MEKKKCSRCKKTRLEKFFRFIKNRNKLDCYCLDCRREMQTEWEIKNPKKRAGYVKKQREKDGDKIRKRALDWYYQNKKRAKKNNKLWREKNPEAVANNSLKFYLKNKEKIAEEYQKNKKQK